MFTCLESVIPIWSPYRRREPPPLFRFPLWLWVPLFLFILSSFETFYRNFSLFRIIYNFVQYYDVILSTQDLSFYLVADNCQDLCTPFNHIKFLPYSLVVSPLLLNKFLIWTCCSIDLRVWLKNVVLINAYLVCKIVLFTLEFSQFSFITP